MKKIILLLLFTSVTYAQENIGTYFNPLAKVSYPISATKPDNKQNFSYYIECKSIDSQSKQAVLIIEKQDVKKFKDYLNYLKDLFLKWKVTAEENKITDVTKKVDFENKFYESAFSYGDWNFSRNTILRAEFKFIIDQYYIVIFSSKLQSTSNQFMKSNGYMLSFNSISAFDDLAQKIDEEKVISFYNEKAKKEDLFKN